MEQIREIMIDQKNHSNQLAGIDLRWKKVFDAPIALYDKLSERMKINFCLIV